MSWGKIYCDTNWGENKYRTAGSIINEATPDCFQFPEFVSFKDHVRTEGATYEKMQCGIDILLFLGRSISITPQSPDNPTFSGILDTYTGATAGYSTRRLTNTYTGGLIRVRRSSDDAEQDIGYDANGEDLDIFGLLAFVGGQNLFVQSNQFDTTWSKTADITGGQSGYDGSTDAWLLEANSVNQYERVAQSVTTTGFNTFSIYAKADTADFLLIYNNNFSRRVWFNLSTGSVGSSSLIVSATMEDVGSGWYRCSVVMNLSSSSSQYRVCVANTDNDVNATTGDSIYIQHAQLEEGSTATTYKPTTTGIGGDGAVTTWYDQSGNGNHATNSTASEQPLIVDGGSIIYDGATISRPAIEFDGVDDYLAKIATFTINGDHMISAVHTPQGIGGYLFSLGYNDPESVMLWFNSTNYSRYWVNSSGDQVNSGESVAGQRLTTGEMSSGSQTLYIDGSQNSTKSTTYNGGNVPDISIGYAVQRAQGSNFLIGKVQELIFFNSDQSGNRTGIEGNIDNYFRITS